MAEMTEQTSSKTFRATYVYWGSAYFIAVAILYLWGYWSVFNINILEFVGLSDIAKAAAYPIASTFVLFAVGAVLGEVFFPHGMFPSGGGANTSTGRTLNRFAALLFALYAGMVALLYLFGPAEKWRVLPVLIAPPVALIIKRTGFLSAALPSDSTRTVVLFLLVTLPPFAYGHGLLKALAVRDGTSFVYSVSPIEGVPVLANATAQDLPRYLGLAGEHMFFFEPAASSVLLTSISQAKTVRLKVYPDESRQKSVAAKAKASSAASGL